ncbi:MAG: hypothetical protein IJP66_09615 [Kiritimatiellae bacterium]|nr:hypothetical protein [Kiritimatiellia bacterium]
MKRVFMAGVLTLGAMAAASGFCASAAQEAGCINVAAYAPADGSSDASEAIQALIDANPNSTLRFADGTYLLSRPIATPADPRRAVSLSLSDFAILKAAPDFPARQPLVRLGGIHPANDIRTPGSVYGLYGGIIDGSGVADGVSIDSGRETRVQNVSMKNVRLGLRIRPGANNNSSDCDIRDVNIVGNRSPDSVGVLVEAHDNSFSNMRIAGCRTGFRLRGGGNRLYAVHPLWTSPRDQFEGSIGFDDGSSNNSYICCYADHFESGWRFRATSGQAVMTQCIAFWYAHTPGGRHTAIRCDGQFRALCSDMQFGFKSVQAVNTILSVRSPGGDGYIADPRAYERLLNDPADAFRDYLRGTVHGAVPAWTPPSVTATRIPSAAALFGTPPALRHSEAVLPQTLDGVAGWTFVSVTNGVCDDVCGAPCGDADLSYHFRCLYDDGGLVVETVVRDDNVATDTCPPGSTYCRSWEDDCAEVFIDGELARLDDSRKDGGRHLWHGGEFVLVANGAAQSRSSAAPDAYIPPARAFGGDLPDANWWTGESFALPGYGHAERFYIPWRSMGHASAPARIGFTISLQDDDNGGGRDHTLYWTGNPAKPHLDERAYGVVEFSEAQP